MVRTICVVHDIYSYYRADNEEGQWYTRALDVLVITLEILWIWLRALGVIVHSVYKFFIPNEPKDVSGDVVLITGAGHGMGREIALRFGRLRATVVCVDVNPKGNEETSEMIRQEGGKVHKYECDVTDRAAVMALAEKVRKEVGDVTILINNAGIMPCRPLLEHTEKEVRLSYDVNVIGCIWMLQAFLKPMMEKNRGHLVSMASMAGLLGSKNLVPYCGTKFAVRGIMEALATELRQDMRDFSGIKMTTICPYIVNTGLCHKPKIRFREVMKPVEPADAADQILDAIRREYLEITVPSDHYYSIKMFRTLPQRAMNIFFDYGGVEVEPHDPKQFA